MTRAESRPGPPPRSPGRIGDHMANERTFLAWVRTALSLIGLGFVLARMGLFLRELALTAAAPLQGLRTGQEFLITGVVFLLLGSILCGWTGWLYDRNRRAIDEDRYEPARLSALSLSITVLAGGLIIVGLVLWQTMSPG
jgi:putative membrane protein